MKVFKLYLQVLKSKLPMVYMYSGVFISIMLIITFLGPQNNSNLEFTGAKINIAYIDKDNTEFTRNLKEEISKNASIIDLGTNEEELNDALFFRRITIIVRVPDGFTADLENNVDSEIRFSSLPDSYEQELLSRRVNKYINTYKAYRIGTNLSLEEVIEKTNEDMAVTSKVSMSSSNLDGNTSLEARYFNYAVYIILAILISVIGLTMNSINNQIVKKR
ncbi:MAG: ABC transporter permease, partial [Lachnospiraceae bacterium]|nr:ABC transporter permease [Lachnospiraceae bacterium]